MAFDAAVADRVRRTLKSRKGVTERKMFGGVAFMVNGHMCCGVVNGDLVLRLGDEGAAAALKEKHVRPMDFTGKPLRSIVYVGPDGHRDDKRLKAWIARGVKFVRSLPPKA